MEKRIIQVEEKVPVKLLIPLSIQHMFAMFGASVLVPFLFGISPAIVLFMNGIGTLLFIAITKGKAPAYLGSSFAFLAPASIVIQNFGYEYALGGFVAVGFCGCILALIIYKFGTDWINIVLPPAAMGPVVALIGLELSANAASNAGLLDENIDPRKIIVFMVTLGVAVFGSILFRKFLAVIPILIAVLAGYAAAIICGIVDFEEVAAAKIIAMPHFSSPKFDAQAIMIILPVILVIISEHIGHQVVTSKIVGRDLLKDPGLHRSLFADNFSTMLSGMIGSVPTTTYGENIGVMAVTGVYSVRVIAGAAILSIICSFVGKLSALISTIPGPVIGGISFLLYGMIGTSGLRILVDCANGAASATAPDLFDGLPLHADFIHREPDGVNINDGCGSTHLKSLSEGVVAGGYDLGIAFDGDADRCLLVDETGHTIDGDKVMAVCGADLRRHGKLSGNAIVATVMSNLGLHEYCRKEGIELVCTAVGDRHVLEKMLECGYAIGGEQSGHTIFREYATTGDGELTALQFLQALRRSGKQASELASCCPQYPQELINVAVSHVPGVKDAIMQDPALRHAIAQMEQELAGKGRVLIRPSGTEALIRVMVEAKTTEVARKVAKDLADLIKILSKKIQF